MVTAWVLIAFMKYGQGSGMTSHEFNSKESCESAAIALRWKLKDERWGDWLFTICVEK